MSSNSVSIFCQVGFKSKERGSDVYFHEIEGRPYGGKIEIHDQKEFLSPFTAEELITGEISFDLLPDELQRAIGEVAQRTCAAIERVNPGQISRIHLDSVKIKFSLMGGDDLDIEHGMLQ
ncbi:MAG: hypothetical protein HHAS10_06230 [Candidatus Altimarinota bacterium]